jgi:hypothetical protein
MSELLNRLKAGRAAIGKVSVGGVELGLRVLSEQDYLDAQIATELAMNTAGLVLGLSTAEAFESEKASQLLARAVVDPLSGALLATSAQALRLAVSREEQAFIIDAYLAHEKMFSPSERTLDAVEFSGLLEEVKKTPQSPPLSDLSIATLKRLITALACPPTP